MLTVKTSSPNHRAILESLSTLLLTLTPGRGHVFIITAVLRISCGEWTHCPVDSELKLINFLNL